MVARRLALARRLRRVQPLPGAARDAAAAARHVDRPGTAGDRVRRAHLPGDRRARGDPRPRTARRRCLRGPGVVAFERRHVRLRPGAARAARRRPRARGRARRRADRAHGLRQDHRSPRSSRASTTSRRGASTIDGARRARRDAHLAAARDRRDRAGSVPLLGDRAREHRLRPARRDGRGGRAGGAAGAGARVHRGAAATATTR